MGKDTQNIFDLQQVFQNIIEERKAFKNFEFWLLYMSYKRNSLERKSLRLRIKQTCFSDSQQKKAENAFKNWLSGKTQIPFLYARSIHTIIREFKPLEFETLFPNYSNFIENEQKHRA